MQNTVVSIINLETSFGQQYLRSVEKLKTKLFPKFNTDEKLRLFKELTDDEISKHKFLTSFMREKADKEMQKIYNSMHLKKVYLGTYGRRGGATYTPCQDTTVRIILHFGDSELYYLDSDTARDEPHALLTGQGFMFNPYVSQNTSVTVYAEPIRLVYDSNLQSKVPKIRPRNYNRTTLILDFDFIFTEEELLEDKETDNKTKDNQVTEAHTCNDGCSHE
jgi:hypothetical protein